MYLDHVLGDYNGAFSKNPVLDLVRAKYVSKNFQYLNGIGKIDFGLRRLDDLQISHMDVQRNLFFDIIFNFLKSEGVREIVGASTEYEFLDDQYNMISSIYTKLADAQQCGEENLTERNQFCKFSIAGIYSDDNIRINPIIMQAAVFIYLYSDKIEVLQGKNVKENGINYENLIRTVAIEDNKVNFQGSIYSNYFGRSCYMLNGDEGSIVSDSEIYLTINSKQLKKRR